MGNLTSEGFFKYFCNFFSWFNKLLSFSPPLLTKNFLAMVSHDQANLIKIHDGILQHFKDSPLSYYIWDGKAYFDGNKAKEWISKRMFQDNKARQIFWKTNLSYPMTRTPCAYQGVKKYSFFGEFGVLFSWNIRFEIRPFALLPTNYSWEDAIIQKWNASSLLHTSPEIFAKEKHRSLADFFCSLSFLRIAMIIRKQQWNQ